MIEDLLEAIGAYIVLIIAVWVFLAIILPIILNSKASKEGKKSVGCAYLLLFFWFPVAAHRFYAGKAGSAVLWIFTAMFFGFGPLIDLFLIPGMIGDYNQKAETNKLIRQNNQMIQQIQYQQHGGPVPPMQQPVTVGDAQPGPGYYDQPIPMPMPMRAPARRPMLIGLSGQYAGARMEIDDGGVVLGRDESCAHLVFDDGEISSMHCLVSYSGGQFAVSDYSANGTFMASGNRLPKDSGTVLKPGDVFYLVSRKNMFKVTYA